MSIVWKLALAQVRQHPARTALTGLAMVAAACVVVWVVSGYDALVGQFAGFASEYLGRYDLIVLPDRKPGQRTPPELSADVLAALRQDPAVAEVDPVAQLRVRFLNPKHPEASASPLGPPGSGPSGRSGGPSGGPGGGAGTGPGAGAAPSGGPGRGPGGGPGRGPGGGPGGRPPMFFMPMLVGTDAPKPPYPLISGKWLIPAGATQEGAVVSRNVAERLQLDVGDELQVTSARATFSLTVIGIAEQRSGNLMMGGRPGGGPGMMSGPASAAVYVPLALAGRIGSAAALEMGPFGPPAVADQAGGAAPISFANVLLKDRTQAEAFRTAWTPRLAAGPNPASVLSLTDVRASLDEGMSAVSARKQAYSATGMSLLASLFIIFTTLSMGVSERIRQLAVLRAVALSRVQVAGLIVAESLVLALLGWAGGLAAGWVLLKVVAHAKPGFFTGGTTLGTWCVVLTGASAFGGALAAALLPAWRAMRVNPLDAVTPTAASRPLRWPLVTSVVGVAMIGLNPLLVFVAPIPDQKRYLVYTVVGCTSMAIGFVLLAPLAVVAVERLLGPVAARLLLVEPRLLRTQLSGNLWRTIGTTVALTIGLGLFVAMQVWGYTMLGPFVPGQWVPDAMIAFLPGGVPDTAVAAVQHAPGIVADRCLPLAVEQPRLADDPTHELDVQQR